jgi:hypothetical protein
MRNHNRREFRALAQRQCISSANMWRGDAASAATGVSTGRGERQPERPRFDHRRAVIGIQF